MTQVSLPNLKQTGANEWEDVEGNDRALRDVINGQLANDNLSGSAGITGANIASATITNDKLANPGSSVYRTIFFAGGALGSTWGAATYLLGSDGIGGGANQMGQSPDSVGTSSGYQFPPVFRFVAADYAVSGLTTKLQIRAQVLANATAPAINFTIGLYPVTVAGGASVLTFTAGTVVSGSTVAINTPPASTVTAGVASAITIPSDGTYMLGVATNASIALNSLVMVAAQLQTRNV
jgi:hypothetical protein